MAKTVEEIYQKKTPVEHILIRPDTYIGSIESETKEMYVYDDVSKKIIPKTISFRPGLYKIFDEILVNAADNKIRDKSMTTIRVDIDKNENKISIFNDGLGIPIEMHSKENVYVPELIFGHLLTSSNYNDDIKKVTGGRNGYGAKLCNIYSNKFVVETANWSKKKMYKQEFSKNMSIRSEPEIDRYKGKDYTRITFYPDLKRFKMSVLDDDIISLMKKRVVDMCGTVRNIIVYLNGEKLDISSFKDYVKLYIDDDKAVVHQVINDRWELAFTTDDEQFRQVSFVNSISTSNGGTHVNHVMDQIVEKIQEASKRKDKSVIIKPMHVRSSSFVFVNCLIENPSFDSQTKENLTLKISSFGSKCSPIDGFIKNVVKKTDIVERVMAFSRAKLNAQIKKADSSASKRLNGILKLEDANNAGTKKGKDCTLILTEGDSAKALVIAGFSIIGRDNYGVFPLKGKLLNVRDAPSKQIMDNQEICNIKKIIGLKHGEVYEDTSSLRYGHLMIMTDQDNDGSHIKGLLINFFDHFFPSLLKVKGFLQEFITPIVRATKGTQIKEFFTIPEFETWKSEEDQTGWKIKYYKGLGTSNRKDAQQYFSNLPRHVKNFDIADEVDKGLVDLAFNKRKAEDRKDWLARFVPGTFLDQSVSSLKIKDFVNKELILFSMADNLRSIPNVVDGLKPGQRKVMFACFKRKLHEETKVAQLVGYVSEHTAYHHGEASLSATIVNLAQDFVGSNNINLLRPMGQFGTRNMGGKDAASPRYIYTYLSELTRYIFRQEDENVIDQLIEDNLKVEPLYYVPIIPMVLVNEVKGIGTGWSTSIPSYNPIDIINNIRKKIDNQPMEDMIPFYQNFQGEIVRTGSKFVCSGLYERVSETEVLIKELPVGCWTENYKQHLISLQEKSSIHTYNNFSTDLIAEFQVFSNGSFDLNIEKTISLSNMVCFDHTGKLKRYSSPQEIIDEFFVIRVDLYKKRREFLLAQLLQRLDILRNKMRFITEVNEGIVVISKRKKVEIESVLERRDYLKVENTYDYLLRLPISSLTHERVVKHAEEVDLCQKEYENLYGMTVYDIWRKELDEFEVKYREKVAADSALYSDRSAQNKQKSKIKKPNLKAIKRTSKNANSKDSNNSKEKMKKTVKSGKATKTKESTTKSKQSTLDNVVKKKTPSKKSSLKKSKKEEKSSESDDISSSYSSSVISLSEEPKKVKGRRFDISSSSDNEEDKPWKKYQ